MRATTPIESPAPDQLSFSFSPTMTPQGDGSFVVRPGRPVTKLTLMEAAKVARTSYATIRRLYIAGLICGERPSPHSIRIYAESLQSHLERSRDLELWDGSALSDYQKALN